MKIDQRSVRLGRRNGRLFTTMNIRHSYVHDGLCEYLIGRYPEGDFAIHQINCRGRIGYGGEVITFLMDDGELVEVKGPLPCDDLFEHAMADRIADVLERPEVAVKAFGIEVGSGLTIPGRGKELAYQEVDFILGDWIERIRLEWAGMDVRVYARSGAMCFTVVEVLCNEVSC